MKELSERASRILHAVVIEYIETSEPVGSRTLAAKYQIDLSPASIRNVMAELEEAGYLYQPHTSAGRVPTDQAFRAFVDRLMTLDALSGDEKAELRALDTVAPGEELLRESGRVLSKLAGTASVVIVPHVDRRRLSQLHFIVTQNREYSLLAVLIFTDGIVESRFVNVENPPSDQELERVHNVLAEVIRGNSLKEVRDRFARELARHRDDFEQRAYQLGKLATEPTAATQPLVVVHGQSRLLSKPDFSDVDRVCSLIAILEDRERLLLLLDRTIDAPKVQVLVGREANLANGSISLVYAPFQDAGEPAGTIAILGPTRMNYPKVVPLVSATAHVMSAAHARGSDAGHDPAGAKRKERG